MPQVIPQKPAVVMLSADESAAIKRRRVGRNIALLVVLVVLCGLFYAIAMVKMAKTGL
ncbi:MAG TPA: hypothetical protein VMU82_00125 [Acetobacteraceae bacterium]|nr:hypothetical protein [Acetobacteraceae bacterium]